jgi:diphthine synthase
MLKFIGIGLFDEKDLSLRAIEEARDSDVLFAEFYTSQLAGTSLDKLKKVIGKDISELKREDVESSEVILNEAMNKRVAFLVPGDPLIATTHIALRLSAKERGIETMVVHNASIYSAAPSISGLFSYKFGRSASIPFPRKGYAPESFYDALRENRIRGLHTLLFLDTEDKLMSVNEALSILSGVESKRGEGIFKRDSLVVGLGSAGSDKPVLAAGKMENLIKMDFGPKPHTLIVPGELHFIEEEYLKEFGGLKSP